MSHHCHARDCQRPVPPEMLMCGEHWRMVPSAVQAKVWRHYRHGQCDDKNPSQEWLDAADEAIRCVAVRESKKVEPSIPQTDRQVDPFMEWFHRFMDGASSELAQRIQHDPYIIGYQNVGHLRGKMGSLDRAILSDLKVERFDPRRLVFFAWWALESAVARDGHTAVPTETVLASVQNATGAPRKSVLEAIAGAVAKGGYMVPFRRADGTSCLCLPLCHESERRIAERVAKIVAEKDLENP